MSSIIQHSMIANGNHNGCVVDKTSKMFHLTEKDIQRHNNVSASEKNVCFLSHVALIISQATDAFYFMQQHS